MTKTNNQHQLLLTVEQAYQAMFQFLEISWERNQTEDLAILLGSMSLQSDGLPTDPALWADWKQLCEKVKNKTPNYKEQEE